MLGQIEQSVSEAVNFIQGVVVHQGSANGPTVRTQTEPPHQPRRVHVTVADADAGACQRFGNACRGQIAHIEAKRGNSFTDLLFFR